MNPEVVSELLGYYRVMILKEGVSGQHYHSTH